MAVATETPKRFRGRRGQLRVRALKRHANGEWTVHAHVKVRLNLGDGREVVVDRRIPIRAHQVGQKKVR